MPPQLHVANFFYTMQILTVIASTPTVIHSTRITSIIPGSRC